MYGIKWFKGANYYQVRGYLLKNGFKRTERYGYYDKAFTKGWVIFDDGVEEIKLECTLKRNEKGNLVCDKVYAYSNKIYDSLRANGSHHFLLEHDQPQDNINIQEVLIITDNTADDVSVKWDEKEKSSEFIPYEYRFVDMGLESGLLWAEYNLGAFPGNSAKNWYGDYYTWADVKAKKKFYP